MRINFLIRDYIEKNGLKFNFVAEKAGIPEKRFYKLMNGESPMKIEEYETICKKGLSKNPAYFFKQKFSENENITA